MNKLWLIIQREYLTRVRKRSFILTTLLTPIGFIVFFVVISFIMSYESEDLRIAVKDDSGILNGVMKDEGGVYYQFNSKGKNFQTLPLDDLLKNYEKWELDGVLHVPKFKNIKNPDGVAYYSEKQLGINTKMSIERKIAREIEDLRFEEAGYNRDTIQMLKTSIALEQKSAYDKDGEEQASGTAEVATVLGGIMGFIIYIVLFVYGTMVMRSVMEEKTTRIVEVMISSVKPFQLMLGKIIGVGGVGLTQLSIWLIIMPLLYLGAGIFLGITSDPDQLQQMAEANAAGGPSPDEMEAMIMQFSEGIAQQNWVQIISLFIFYFLGGYFLYASLFAAVGSAMGDDMGESQSLTLPITIPVILAIYIMFAVIQNPNSGLATWSSMIPLFSPIVMPARIPFDPPIWEIALSMFILAASAFFFVWLSGRIYRVGILLYGKKVTLRELGKWMFYKE